MFLHSDHTDNSTLWTLEYLGFILKNMSNTPASVYSYAP